MLYKERGKVMRKTAVYYVDINAPVNGNGSRKRPFRHINDAARVALPGDEVVVLPGIYREYVNPIHAGTEEAPIIYRSEKMLGAVITGAEILTDWTIRIRHLYTETGISLRKSAIRALSF